MSMGESLVLGADVGGTNTKMALARFDGAIPIVAALHVYKSGEHVSLESVIEAFLRRPEVAVRAAEIAGTCFAVAGPVEHGRGKLTNLPWQPDEGEIAGRFAFPRVRIINDFAAAGRGIEHLGRGDLLTLQTGVAEIGASRVVLGAGTGLGVALLDWDANGYEVHSSEAGHTDFAPVDAVQVELLAHLRAEFKRVSHERVICGKGLKRILDFVEHSGTAVPSEALKAAMEAGDPPGVISEFALAARDEAAVRALNIFVTAYGSFAGNMALTMLAHGGVYLAGGIAPKIVSKLSDGTFMRAFSDKGRFRSVLESMPVHVVMNDHVGLYGALAEAAQPGRVD
jgi:glucokinase